MTLLIDSSQISITNKDNTVKFTSNDKLVYLKHSILPTVNISSSEVIIPWTYTFDASKDFFQCSVRFNSSNGNVLTDIAEKGFFIPANGSIPTNFYGRGVFIPVRDRNVACADEDYMSIVLFPTYISIKPVSVTYNVYGSYSGTSGDRNILKNSTIVSNVTVSARIYSYL